MRSPTQRRAPFPAQQPARACSPLRSRRGRCARPSPPSVRPSRACVAHVLPSRTSPYCTAARHHRARLFPSAGKEETAVARPSTSRRASARRLSPGLRAQATPYLYVVAALRRLPSRLALLRNGSLRRLCSPPVASSPHRHPRSRWSPLHRPCPHLGEHPLRASSIVPPCLMFLFS